MSTDAGPAPSWTGEPAQGPTPARHPALAPRVITGAPLPAARPRYRHRAVVTVVAVLVAGASFAGGAIAERVTRSGVTVSAPSPAASRVATAWVDASGESDLGRTGTLRATVEPVGWQDDGSTVDTWFVVVPTGKPAFGLTVRMAKGSLAAIPSISPLPFGGGALPPPASTGSQSTESGPPGRTTSATATRWAQETFGPHSALAASPGIALVGTPKIVARWPASPGGTVVELRVQLGTSAPGTPATTARRRMGHDGAVVTADRATIAADVHTVSRAAATDASDTATLNTAEAAATAASAASAAASAAAAAPPGSTPTPASTAAATTAAAASATATAAVGPAQTAATAAAQALAADRAKEVQDRRQLRRDQAALASATARVPSPFTAVGTYDVWVRGTSVKGWVPVGYRGD